MTEPAVVDALKRQYRRLQITSANLFEARQYASYILDNRLHEQARTSNTLPLKALSLALVVTYARSFLDSDTEGLYPTTSRVPESVLRALSSDDRAFHDRLMRLRHDEIAHSAAAAHDVKTSLRTPPDGSAERVAISIQRGTVQPLTEEETDRFLRMADLLAGEVISRQHAIQERLADEESF